MIDSDIGQTIAVLNIKCKEINLQYFSTYYSTCHLMSKLLKIRRAINQMKRNSALYTLRDTQFCLQASTSTERSPILGHGTGFNIFPVASSRENTVLSGSEESSSQEFADASLYQKTDARPFIREKKTLNCPGFRVMKRNKDFLNKTVTNVSELMAHPVKGHIRINKASDRNNRHMSTIQRSAQEDESTPKTIKYSIDTHFKGKRQRCSPKKVKKGWTSRVRKAVSPKKHSSPVIRFELTAWQTSEDMEFQLN